MLTMPKCINKGCNNLRATYNDGSPRYKSCFRCHKLNFKYGLTGPEADSMVLAQENKCAICIEPLRPFEAGGACIDHNHKTGKVRGILCHNCNSGIGKLREDRAIFMNALIYLEFHD